MGYVYISIYEAHARFSGTPGALVHTQNRATGESTQAARAGGDRPAPALILIGTWTKRSCPPSTNKPAEPQAETRIMPSRECRIIKVARHFTQICPSLADTYSIPQITRSVNSKSAGAGAATVAAFNVRRAVPYSKAAEAMLYLYFPALQ